jgi:hypothetical protein
MTTLNQRLLSRAAEAQLLPLAEFKARRPDQCMAEVLGKRALYKTVGLGNMRQLEKRIGAEIVAFGHEQLVFRANNDDEDQEVVIKLLLRSLGLPQAELEPLVRRCSEEFSIAAEEMRDSWVDTHFYTTDLPRTIGSRAIMAVQPLVRPLISFKSVDDVYTHFIGASDRSSLSNFIGVASSFYENAGMYPDIFGVGNLMLIDNDVGGKRLWW